MKVVTVSRRTDIPAFYAEWFMNRIRAGFAEVENPFNRNRPYRVSLAPEKVACLVFCTKDPRPLLPRLDELESRGFRYLFQVTVTGLPKLFEPSVPPAAEIVAAMKTLAERIGPDRLAWRFDPLVISDLTAPDQLSGRFRELAAELAGSTRRVIVSLVQPYRNAAARLRRAVPGIRFPQAAEITGIGGVLASQIAATAADAGMQVYSCAGPAGLERFGIPPGSCIDGSLIRRLFGIPADTRRDPGQRRECGCTRSVDIGAYGSCRHSCLYCYASRDAALRLRRHDPDLPTLLAPPERSATEKRIPPCAENV